MLTFEEIEDCFPEVGGTTNDGSVIVSAQWLHNFARAVEAKEREACAKLCGEPAQLAAPYTDIDGWLSGAAWCEAAIRARSNEQGKPPRDGGSKGKAG